jgi:hypothetical protein
MNPALPRSIVKLRYAATRLPFTLLEDFVVARYWDQNAPACVGFERWLGSLDLLVGRLLADDQISRRGHALMRPTAPWRSPSLSLPTSTPRQSRCAGSSMTGRPRISGSNAAVTGPGRPQSPSSQAVAIATATCWMASAGKMTIRPTTMRQILSAASIR